jgi:hypothetical protein
MRIRNTGIFYPGQQQIPAIILFLRCIYIIFQTEKVVEKAKTVGIKVFLLFFRVGKNPGFLKKNPAQWVFLGFFGFFGFFWVFWGFFARTRGFLGFFQFHEYF